MAEARRRRFTPKQKAHIIAKLLEENRTIAELAEEFDIHPIQLHRWKNQAVSNLHRLFEKDDKQAEKLRSAYEERIGDMQEEIEQLNRQLEWLKRVAALNLPKENRSGLVQLEEPALPIRTQTELLGLSRSTLYYQLRHKSSGGISARRSGTIGRLGDVKPAFLPVGLNVEQMRQIAEIDLPRLKIQNGWMDVFGGYH